MAHGTRKRTPSSSIVLAVQTVLGRMWSSSFASLRTDCGFDSLTVKDVGEPTPELSKMPWGIEQVECYRGPLDGDLLEIPTGMHTIQRIWNGVFHRYTRRDVWDTDMMAKFDHMGEV